MVDGGEVKTTFETATFNHPNTTSETDLIEFLTLKKFVVLNLDFINLTQSTTINVYDKIDGTNYRLLSTKIYPNDYDTNIIAVSVILDGGGQDMKITLTSGILEGSARDILADIRKEDRE
jgi:hypothetical protein